MTSPLSTVTEISSPLSTLTVVKRIVRTPVKTIVKTLDPPPTTLKTTTKDGWAEGGRAQDGRVTARSD